jgi:hypothetical protein
MCVFNNKIYAFAFLDNWDQHLIEINPETLTARLVNETYIRNQFYNLFSFAPTENIPVSIGQATPSFVDFQSYYYYSDGRIQMTINKNYIKEEDLNNIYAEWTTATSFPETVNWIAINVTVNDPQPENENNWYFDTANPDESEVVIRIRLASDDSDFWYYYYND